MAGLPVISLTQHGVPQTTATLPPPAVKVWSGAPASIDSEQAMIWLNDHQLLYETEDREGTRMVGYLVRQHDFASNTDVLLQPLNDHLKQWHGTPIGWHPFSPDGSKLACAQEVPGGNPEVLLSVQGKRLADPFQIGGYRSEGVIDCNPGCWLSDSQGYLELQIDQRTARYSRVLIHPAQGSGKPRLLPLSPPVPYGNWDDQEPTPTTDGKIVMLSHRDRWVTGGDGSTNTENVTEAVKLTTISLSASGARAATIPVALPVQGQSADPYLSPSGRLLVWRVRSSFQHQRKESLWVSERDGRNAHKVLEVDWNAPSYALAFTDVSWLPDSHRVSFVCEGALYTMPVPSYNDQVGNRVGGVCAPPLTPPYMRVRIRRFTTLCELPGNDLPERSDLYGTTMGGRVLGRGTIFKLTTSGLLTTLHSFTGFDGTAPESGLVQGRDGSLYGTAEVGGTGFTDRDGGGCGTVFKITTSGVFTLLHRFDGRDGAGPEATLIQGKDGNLYGTTRFARPGRGTVFRITPSGLLTTLHRFNGGLKGDGVEPYDLIQGKDGNLYGTTSGGGYRGTIFKLTMTPVISGDTYHGSRVAPAAPSQS
jgi:uncharacterized repeat protein (TIGR03803 family)